MSTPKTNTIFGFTLVEVLVISPISVLMTSAFIAVLVNLAANALISSSRSIQMADTHTVLPIIEETVTLSSAFLTEKELHLSDPYGQDDNGATISYQGAAPDTRSLITRAYATSSSPRDPDKTPVYVDVNGCDSTVIGTNPVLSINVIFFVKNGNLYRRTLTDTSKTLCSPMFQQHSCPATISPRDPVCQANDTLLLSNVTGFDVQYFENSHDNTPMEAYVSNDPDILQSAETVRITLTSSQLVAGETVDYTNTLTISRIHI